jgi:hypothetical protein
MGLLALIGLLGALANRSPTWRTCGWRSCPGTSVGTTMRLSMFSLPRRNNSRGMSTISRRQDRERLAVDRRKDDL